MTTLTNLIERVEAATGADRKIDAAICAALRIIPESERQPELAGDIEADGAAVVVWHKAGSVRMLKYSPPDYTASLDAAIALVEKVLPDHGWFLRRDDTDANGRRAAPIYNAALLYPDALRVIAASGQRPTPALALCLALLKAKLSESPLASKGG